MMRIDPTTQGPVGIPRTAAPAPEAGAAVAEQPGPVSAGDLRAAMENVNRYLRSVNSDVQFSVDDSTGRTVVRVIDPGTREVIRQMPSEEMLAISHALDRSAGLLVRETV